MARGVHVGKEAVEDYQGGGVVFDGSERVGDVDVRLQLWEAVAEFTNVRGETRSRRTGFSGSSGHMRFVELVAPPVLQKCARSNDLRLELDDGRTGAMRITGTLPVFDPPDWISIEGAMPTAEQREP